MRIGAGGTQTSAFIAGINGVTTGGAAVPVLVDANGQLGTASSSRRYKFDIADMASITDRVMRLRPVTFRYVSQGASAALQFGLVAEEVASVYPELVTRDPNGEPNAVMYQFLAPMLVNVVQQQQRRIDELERRLAALEERLK